MKKVLFMFTFLLLTSFSKNFNLKILPDGNYRAHLDEEYRNNGLVDFNFTIEKEKFIIVLGGVEEKLDIIPTDENSFIVKGYTEPKNPTQFEESILKNGRPAFKITKQINNEYYFFLGIKGDEVPIYTGKFIKFKE